MGHTKGSAIVEGVKFLRTRRDDALRVLPPELHSYLDEPIKRASWYPSSVFVALIRACAELSPGTLAEALQRMGEISAHGQSNDIFGDLLLGRGSTARTLALWGAQHDTGTMRRTPEAPGRLRFDVVGYEDTSSEHCELLTGYLKGSVELNGYGDVRVAKIACVLRSDPICSWRVSYKPNLG